MQLILLLLLCQNTLNVADIFSDNPAIIVSSSQTMHPFHPTKRALPTVIHLKQFHFSNMHLLPFFSVVPERRVPVHPPHIFRLFRTRFNITFTETKADTALLAALAKPDYTMDKKIMSLITFAHLMAIEIVIANKYEIAYIFEDDVHLDGSIRSILDDLWATRPHNGIMFQLNTVIPRERNCSSRSDRKWIGGIEYGAGAYIVTLSGAHFLRPHLLHAIETGDAVDVVYSEVLKPHGGGYHLLHETDTDWNDLQDARRQQRWRYIMRECGLASQRPILSIRENPSSINLT